MRKKEWVPPVGAPMFSYEYTGGAVRKQHMDPFQPPAIHRLLVRQISYAGSLFRYAFT